MMSCGKNEPELAEGYVNPRTCEGCHASIALSYRETGMARAFHRITPEEVPAGEFRHEKSGLRYRFVMREGKVYLERGEIAGVPAVEKEIHYVLGSGNHARSFVHRTPEGRLLEMPVNWYPEDGGKLAMSPGYDRADHFDMRRALGYQCVFCHNGYPKATGTTLLDDPVFEGEMPQGIDCQRCHGPGKEHVAAGGRGQILNPRKLSAQRKTEVCLQCHLETTSFSLPNSIVRFDRSIFSYKPSEPLGNYIQHFDHAPGTGHEDKFEIASSAYRMRQSKCFKLSREKLTCVTCHNPHERTVRAKVDQACQSCHPNFAALPNHAQAKDCASCHMPLRRTEDVVHVAVTDHKVQRPAAKVDYLARREERHEVMGKDSYRGEVVPYYPAQAESELYLALAQVIHQSNLERGVPRLEAAMAKEKPRHPAFAVHLAAAKLAQGDAAGARQAYEEALKLDENYLPALRNLAASQREAGDLAGAKATIEKTLQRHAKDSLAWLELAKVEQARNDLAAAAKAARQAALCEPELVEAHKRLAAVLTQSGDMAGAEAALLEGLKWQPGEAEMRTTLAGLLARRGEGAKAETHLRQAVRLAPGLKAAHFNLGLVLAQQNRYAEAVGFAEAAVRLDGRDPAALDLLGSLYMATRNFGAAANLYRQFAAFQPAPPRALLGLGTALGAMNDFQGARQALTRAAEGPDAAVAAEARELLRTLPY